MKKFRFFTLLFFVIFFGGASFGDVLMLFGKKAVRGTYLGEKNETVYFQTEKMKLLIILDKVNVGQIVLSPADRNIPHSRLLKEEEFLKLVHALNKGRTENNGLRFQGNYKKRAYGIAVPLVVFVFLVTAYFQYAR